MIGTGPLLAGLVLLVLILACVFGASALLMARWGQALTGPMRALGHAVVATAILLAIHILPGMFGMLSRTSVLVAAALALAIAWWASRQTPRRAARPRYEMRAGLVAGSPASWVLALAVTGAVVGAAVAYLRLAFGTVPLGVDALTFHLPDVSRWIQTGSLWQIDQYVPELANGNYPNNGDVIFLALMLPFRSAVLVRAAMIPYLALSSVGVYAVARQLRSPRSSALLFAAASAAIPAVVDPALVDTQTDTLMLFGFVAGGAFLIRHHRSASGFDLVLAGLALGISFGTKWYGVPCVSAAIVLWTVGRLTAGIPARLVVRQGAVVSGLVLAAGGFWLLRNLVESADPFFPLRIAPFGLTIFNAPPDVVRQQGGFTISHYFFSPHIIRVYILPALRDTVTWLGALIGVGAVGAGLTTIGRRSRGRGRSADRLVLLVAFAAIVLALIYTVTPDTALGPPGMPAGAKDNTRYLMPALLAAAPLGAWLCGRLPGLGRLIETGALALVWTSLDHAYHLHSALPLVLALVAAGGFLLARRLPRAALRWRVALRQAHLLLRAAAVYALLLVVVVAGALWARPRLRYQTYSAGDQVLGWVLRHEPSGQRVGLANVWSSGLAPVFPVFGPRLDNRVAYVGTFVDHMLEQYRSQRAFDRALRQGRYDLLLVGLGFPYPHPTVTDEFWASAAGYVEVAHSDRFALLAPRAGALLARHGTGARSSG